MEWVLSRRRRNIATFIFYYHDECVVYKYDGRKFGWFSKTVRPLLPKSDGKGCNISDFVSEVDGFLRVGDERARVIHEIGNTGNGYYWTNEHMVKQALKAVELHEKKYNIKTDEDRRLIVPVFVFDNSGTHTKRAHNALNARKMNVGPGGKNQPQYKDGWWLNGRTKVIQKMCAEDGKPKGMRQICKERGYFVDKHNKKQLIELLENELDFMEDKKHNILIDAIQKRYNNLAVVKFNVKFHPELALSIENSWAFAKSLYRRTQQYKTGQTSTEVMAKLHWCMDKIPLSTIRKYFIKQRLFEDCYRTGATAGTIYEQVLKLKKTKSRHR